MLPKIKKLIVIAVFCLLSVPAWAGLNLEGSFSDEGGFARRYVPPLTNALYNETPYITTEVSLWYWRQNLPDDSLTGGGRVELGAAQARLALTDRLGIIATKDGYADFHFDSVLPDTHGFANIAAGLKYAFIVNPEENHIVTGGIRYEAPVGDIETAGVSLQGHGDGMVDVFVTAAKNWDKLGLQGSVGTNVALDGDDNTSQLHYSVHADYALTPKFYPVLEFNGFTPIDEGNRGALGFEGHDVLNLGFSDVGTTLTAGIGCRYLFNDNAQIGAAWEESVSDREDLFDSRFVVDVIFNF